MPGWKAMKELSQWRETVKFPDPEALDWEGMAERFRENSDPDKVNIAMLNTAGVFLIPVNMLGWEDALCAVCEEPEEMEAFCFGHCRFSGEDCGKDRRIHPSRHYVYGR